MKQQMLLLEDVDGLGRSGDIVAVAKPGYIRNFLIPQKKAVPADKSTLKMQAKLQAERLARASVDRKESEELAEKLSSFQLPIEVKVDPDGKMYGSVTTLEIARLLQEKGFGVERKNVLLPQPIKSIGVHTIQLKLKEGVSASFVLEITSESGQRPE